MQRKTIDFREQLRKESIIRVAIDSTRGNGNQVASLQLMNRIRSFGFRGTFEVIYTERGREKVINLFALPNTLSGDFFDAERRMRFLSVVEHLKRFDTLVEVSFGLTGGMDYGIDHSSEKQLLDKLGLSYRFGNKLLKTSIYVLFSPHYHDGTLLFRADKTYYKPKWQDENTFFIVPPLTPMLQDMLTDSFSQPTVDTSPALSYLAKKILSKNIDYWPWYGFTLRSDELDVIPPFFNICEMLIGFLKAQQENPRRFSRPLVISVFYDYRNELNLLMDFLNGGNLLGIRIDNFPEMQSLMLKFNVVNILNTAHLSDVDLKIKTEKLKSGEILILSMGAQPTHIFNPFYTVTGDNVLPAIREGANSFNTLVLTGRPHARCINWGGWDYQHDFGDAQHFWDKFNNLACKSYGSKQEFEEIAYIWTDFIHRAADTNSTLSQAFAMWANEAANPNRDRILLGLQEATNLLHEMYAERSALPKPEYLIPTPKEFSRSPRPVPIKPIETYLAKEWKGKEIEPIDSLMIPAWAGVANGVIAEITDSLDNHLTQKQFSKAKIAGLKFATTGASLFVINLSQKYYSYGAPEDWHQLISSLIEAGAVTGKMIITQIAIEVGIKNLWDSSLEAAKTATYYTTLFVTKFCLEYSNNTESDPWQKIKPSLYEAGITTTKVVLAHLSISKSTNVMKKIAPNSIADKTVTSLQNQATYFLLWNRPREALMSFASNSVTRFAIQTISRAFTGCRRNRRGIS